MKVIFFDGDGTLWYPKETKKKVYPHWIYSDETKKDKYLDHLILTPYASPTLKKLRKAGIILIALSTHPHSKKEADIIMKRKIKHFELENLLDHVYTARNYPEGKGEAIVRILKKLKLPKTQALMIGDSYKFDYMSARQIGVDALLIETLYNQGARRRRALKSIKSLTEVLKFI